MSKYVLGWVQVRIKIEWSNYSDDASLVFVENTSEGNVTPGLLLRYLWKVINTQGFKQFSKLNIYLIKLRSQIDESR